MTTWFVCSGAAGTNAGTSWVNACTSIPGLMTAVAIAAGDTIYVHNTHNYLAGAAITWTIPETGTAQTNIICVDGGDAAFTSAGASMGTTVGSQTSGASESTNGNFAFLINGNFFCHGIQIKAGAGGNSSSADITCINSGQMKQVFQKCTFWTDSTSTLAVLTFSAVSSNSYANVLCIDCVFKFGATGQSFQPASGIFEYYNCSIAGTAPTTFLAPLSSSRATHFFHSCDLSASTNVLSQTGLVSVNCFFTGCTIGTPTTGTHGGQGAIYSEFQGCAAVDGTNGANVLAYYKEDGSGVVQDDQTVYLTTGSAQGSQDDGTATSYSLKMTPSSTVSLGWPLWTPWIYQKIASTGSKTISIKCADTRTSILKDNQLFMQVEYMGGAAPANSPQMTIEGTYPLQSGTVYRDMTASGSNLTDTNEAWTGVTETDTYTLSKTVTLDEQGYIRVRVGLASYIADATNPVYVDPKIAVA